MEPRLLHLLHWQMDSLPIGPPGEPEKKHFHLENIQKFRRDMLWRSSPLFLQLCCCWEPKLGATGVTFTLNHLSLLHLPHPCFKEHPATDPFSSDDLSKDSLRSPLMTPQLLIIVPSLDSTHIPLGIFWAPSLADLAALSPHLPLKLSVLGRSSCLYDVKQSLSLKVFNISQSSI